MNDNIFLTFQIPEGYHLRLSGAGQGYTEPVPCDVCRRPSMTLTGYENDYPNNPDIWVCLQCIFEERLRRGGKI